MGVCGKGVPAIAAERRVLFHIPGHDAAAVPQSVAGDTKQQVVRRTVDWDCLVPAHSAWAACLPGL